MLPPQITISPASLTFDATNWNVTQDITITLQQNDVDHDVETFEIAHAVDTDDTVFLAEATKLPTRFQSLSTQITTIRRVLI